MAGLVDVGARIERPSPEAYGGSRIQRSNEVDLRRMLEHQILEADDQVVFRGRNVRSRTPFAGHGPAQPASARIAQFRISHFSGRISLKSTMPS
jgi:hypothetical protein